VANSNANTTRDAFLRRCFRNIGIDNPSTTQRAGATALLNALLKKLDRQCNWAHCVSNTPVALTTVASQREYTVGVAATNIPDGLLGIDRVDIMHGTTPDPLYPIGKSESISTYNREGTGEPCEYFFDQATLTSANKLHLFPTPAAAYSLKLYARRRLYDFDNASDNPDMPQEHEWDLGNVFTFALAKEYASGMGADDWQMKKADHDEGMKALQKYSTKAAAGPNYVRKTVYF
jgi:hypothetical protein